MASVLERDPGYVDWMLRDTFSPEVGNALIQIRAGALRFRDGEPESAKGLE